MGTKVATGVADPPFRYEWITYAEAVDTAKKLARGMLKLGLVPEVPGDDDKMWRFLGL